MNYKNYPSCPEDPDDEMGWNEFEKVDKLFREDPKNFVFAYAPPGFYDPQDEGSCWYIGLRGPWEDEGITDDSGYTPKWIEDLGLIGLCEGCYESWEDDNDEEITEKLLQLGVHLDPKYGEPVEFEKN
jgi:hypothetical protein